MGALILVSVTELSQVFLRLNHKCGSLMRFFLRGNISFIWEILFLFLKDYPETIRASHSSNPGHFSHGKSPQARFSYLYSNVIVHTTLWNSDSKTMCHAGPFLFSIPKPVAIYQGLTSHAIVVLEEICIRKESIPNRMTFLSLDICHCVAFLHSLPNPPGGSAVWWKVIF